MQQCIIYIGAEVSKASFSSLSSNLFTSYKTELPTCEDKENVEFSAITYKSESISNFVRVFWANLFAYYSSFCFFLPGFLSVILSQPKSLLPKTIIFTIITVLWYFRLELFWYFSDQFSCCTRRLNCNFHNRPQKKITSTEVNYGELLRSRWGANSVELDAQC